MNLATCALLLLTAGPTESAADEMSPNISTAVDTARQQTPARSELHEHPTLLAMLKRNNELRRSVGLRPQRINALLTKAAQNHAWFMARTGNFSHYSNRGPWGRARRFGFGGQVRENIAMGQGSVLSAFRSWRNSSGHWASIVSNAPEVGFGYAVSRNGSPYWVAVYGHPTEEGQEKTTATTAQLKTDRKPANVEHKSQKAAVDSAPKGSTQARPTSAQVRQNNTVVGHSTSGNNFYRRRGIFRRWFR